MKYCQKNLEGQTANVGRVVTSFDYLFCAESRAYCCDFFNFRNPYVNSLPQQVSSLFIPHPSIWFLWKVHSIVNNNLYSLRLQTRYYEGRGYWCSKGFANVFAWCSVGFLSDGERRGRVKGKGKEQWGGQSDGVSKLTCLIYWFCTISFFSIISILLFSLLQFHKIRQHNNTSKPPPLSLSLSFHCTFNQPYHPPPMKTKNLIKISSVIIFSSSLPRPLWNLIYTSPMHTHINSLQQKSHSQKLTPTLFSTKKIPTIYNSHNSSFNPNLSKEALIPTN